MILRVGETYEVTYTLESKVTLTRILTVVGETTEFYLVNTGLLRSTPIKKEDIINITKLGI